MHGIGAAMMLFGWRTSMRDPRNDTVAEAQDGRIRKGTHTGEPLDRDPTRTLASRRPPRAAAARPHQPQDRANARSRHVQQRNQRNRRTHLVDVVHGAHRRGTAGSDQCCGPITKAMYSTMKLSSSCETAVEAVARSHTKRSPVTLQDAVKDHHVDQLADEERHDRSADRPQSLAENIA